MEAQREKLSLRIAELRAMLNGGPSDTAMTTQPATTKKRSKFSAVARRKMALAQKARWARIRGESEPTVPVMAGGPTAKRKLSAAGRANIIAATKKRWALKRAAEKKAAK
jgi:hypothetical protein